MEYWFREYRIEDVQQIRIIDIYVQCYADFYDALSACNPRLVSELKSLTTLEQLSCSMYGLD